MDSLVLFLIVAGCGVLVLPLALHVWHLRNARRLREQLEILARRVAKLEGTTGTQSVVAEPAPASTRAPVAPAPPVPPTIAAGSIAPPPAVVAKERSSLENVIGVKLFAWMGGLALFVGVVLAVSYAFENNLLTPALRVTAGGLVGVALVVGGLIAARRDFRAPAFSMCATGVLVLYGDIYAAHAFYNLLPLWLASVLMSAVSVAAFFLALRLDAQVIVVLGMLGGFLTPTLLWTGANRPLQLFGYAALLNVGVAAVAIRKRWNSLVLLAALGTVVTEFAWLAQFYDAGAASTAPFVFLFFGLEFLLICFARQRLEPSENWSTFAAGAALNAGILAAFSFVYSGDARIHSAGFVFPFIFLCAAGVIALAIGRQFARGGMPRDWLTAVALAFTWAVEWAWLEEHLAPGSAFAPLLWYAAIFALFLAYPYFAGPGAKWPWTISSAAGVLQFWLAYRVVAAAYRTHAIGLLPFAFALPFAAGVWFLVRHRDVRLHSSDSRIASQAGAALVFISLVFPVQFRGEWITVG
ncbi:MAG: DUF2339 domain-containing protein, partial [Chthoniobacterales bacterium]